MHNEIHVFCPTFPTMEMEGTFSFETIQYSDVDKILAHGEWISQENQRTEDQERYPIRDSPLNPLARVHWRHTWVSISRMLNKLGYHITFEMERKASGPPGIRMAIGDIGIIMRPIENKFDLKGKVFVEDLIFIKVVRLA